MFDLDALAVPIVQAPMAGGPNTLRLALAVSGAGGLGFVAAGYRRAQDLRTEITELQAQSDRPFGVNIFVPSPQTADRGELETYLRELEPEAERQGVELGEPRHDDDDYESKLDVVCEQAVPVVSFTFGCPSRAVVDRLHGVGTAVWVTITDVTEALAAQGAGADALVVQGSEAGGHRGGFSADDSSAGIGLLALLRSAAAAVSLPLVGAGAIADGACLAAALCGGARACQVGTALMLAPEAGTAQAQRALLQEPIPTRLTRAFSGRPARGMVNRFLAEHTASAPAGYPEIHHATSPLRAAARRRGDAEAFNLWAGQAHQLAVERPAAEIVGQMAADARRVLGTVNELLGT